MLDHKGEDAGDYRRLGLLVLIMTVVAFAIGGTAIVILYDAAFRAQRERLIETVRSQARLVEAVARFDQTHTLYPDGPRSATLAQIEAAQEALQGRTQGGDLLLVIGQKVGRHVHAHRHAGNGDAETVSAETPGALPMRLALSGQSGTLITPNLRGVQVLVAFEPVAVLDLGIVAELPVADIRRPFLAAAAVVGIVALALVGAGTALFFAVGEPVIRRLRENEALYRRLFEHSPSPKFILDPRTKLFLGVNDALVTLVGYTRDEIARLPLSAYEAKESPEETARHVAGVMEQKTAVFETLWRNKKGKTLTVSVNACVLEMAGAQVIHCVLTDLTARVASEKRARDLQDQLQRATRANELGQMASSLTHEIKQPLTAAMNYINACRRFLQSKDAASQDRAAAASAKAAEQIGRADHFIRGLREYMQHKDPIRSTEEVNPVVAEAVELASTAVDGVQVRLEFADRLPQVAIDRMQIQQVLLNLLRNACEAVAGSPVRVVSIETRPGDEPMTIEIVVSDTGPGLPAEVVDRPFEPFVTTKPGGLGIGLAISLAIVRSHGGSLSAETAAGGGAQFRITLPASPPIPPEPVSDGASR